MSFMTRSVCFGLMKQKPLMFPLRAFVLVRPGRIEPYRFRSGCMTVSSFGRNCRQPFRFSRPIEKARQKPSFSIGAARENRTPD